jgi:hypothetical protein
MDTKNSELDFAVELTVDLLADIADAVGFNASRDALTVRHRCASEGFAFLTKTLPALGKAFDCALSKPNTPMTYPGFRTQDGFPRFLGDLFKLVFDQTGKSLSDAAPSVVRHVRQILYLWYKYELPYTQEQEIALEKRFLETDAALPAELPECPVLQGARDLIARVVADFSYQAVSPRHGPGSVATREQPWEKWRFTRLYQSIERFFPFTEWFVPSVAFLCRSRDPLRNLEILEGGTARAVFVPKDSRGPRLISCEPLEYQWIQQGIASELVYCINKHEYTSGRVNFTHQEVNRRHALMGSMGAGWVTLDMADASDRVSTVLVERLFANTHVLDYLLCSRSPCTVLPSGQPVRMNKFAPMGSALCFPVESLVFFALAVNVLVHHLGYPLDKACARVKVYGDDIIVGREDYAALMQYFPYVGLSFNEKKCCTSGSFRESCGMDAFSGEDVTPVKFRTRFRRRRDSAALVSWVEYSNILDFRGYYRTAQFIEDELWNARCYEAPDIPVLEHGHMPVPCLAFRRHASSIRRPALKAKNNYRWNEKFQRLEFRGVCVRGLTVNREIPGWQRLFASIAKALPRQFPPFRNVLATPLGVADTLGKEELEPGSFPVRRRVTLIRRWCDLGHKP